jgi:small-conductance mechanosensitive channel
MNGLIAQAAAPSALSRGILLAVAATVVYILLVRGLLGARRRLLHRVARRTVAAGGALTLGGYTLLDRDQTMAGARRLVDLLVWASGLAGAYLWLVYVLTRFAGSSAWGEALGGFLWQEVTWLTFGALKAVPGLFTVALVFVATRFIIRLVESLFGAIEQGELEVPWFHADTAQPTRRIATAMLWLFALVVAYPHLPGSGSDAFKGVTVFAGLMLSLGSSGLVNQAMSGLVLMYSRSFVAGDFVRVGDVEGTVTEVGMLSTKVRTTKREEVTLPNALVVSQVTRNYSRLEAEAGVIAHTTVTIGYDTPWRQVHALLELAAARTAGVRQEPRPFVLQLGLSDFYPEYQINVHLEQAPQRARVLSALHANIQDLFSEHGVQIMSPHYENDPAESKVVKPEHWHLPPASPPTH